MADTLLLTVLIVLAAAALGLTALRWVVKTERRAQVRETMDRVYYLRRPMQEDVPAWKRTDSE